MFPLVCCTDDKNEHGLKLEKLGQYFSRFNGVPAKITKQKKSCLVVVPDQICLISYL